MDVNCALCANVVHFICCAARDHLDAEFADGLDILADNAWPHYAVNNPWAGLSRVCRMWREAAAKAGLCCRSTYKWRRWSPSFNKFCIREVREDYGFTYYRAISDKKIVTN
jgi:hypothetical protein